MMNKKFLSLPGILVAAFSLAAFGSQPVKAASYGRIGEVTPPLRMRGKWYYKGSKALGQDPNKLYKIKIGKHHINGIKLYQADPRKTEKYALHFKKYRFIVNQTMNWGKTSIYNIDNVQWLNVTGWTAGGGNGTSYSLTTQKLHHKLLPALAIGVGYKPFIAAYAYRIPGHHQLTHEQKQAIKREILNN